MTAPLEHKLQAVEWGEYKIGDLFEKLDLKFLKARFDKANDVSTIKTNEFSLPLVNAKFGDNGIMYYGREEDFDSAELTLDIVNDGAISTGSVYSQPQKTGVLYNAYLIKPIFEANAQLLHFFACAIQKSIKLKFGYQNKAGWEKVKNQRVKLPVKDGKIDFDFMESFIRELEEERIRELAAYLAASGYDSYELTAAEQAALADFDRVEWGEYLITDIFEVKNTANILSSQIAENSGTTPYLCASAENNAVSAYISFDEQYLEQGNCVFIGGKSFVVSFQEKDFYSNDSHNLALYLKNEGRTRFNQLFLAACVYKGLRHKYSWGDSVSKSKIKSDCVKLPVKDGKIDFAFMELLASAVQKLVIKDVVLYADQKIAATKEAAARK